MKLGKNEIPVQNGYCTQPKEKTDKHDGSIYLGCHCEDCPLISYGKDCHNNPVDNNLTAMLVFGLL